MSRALIKEDETSHFNGKIPQDLRDKMLEVANSIKDDFISDAGGEALGCPNMNAIYGYHISGFIPSQLGGFEISELYCSGQDSSCHFTNAQSQTMDKQQNDCYKSFVRDYREKLMTHGFTQEQLESLDYSMIEAAELGNDFSDYESEWFEPALLRVQMWVDDVEQQIIGNDRQKPEYVYFSVGLGYRDQPYYREKYDETLFTFNISVDDFMAMQPEAIVKKLEEKMKEVK